jgi:twitching motility protein PilT
MPQGQPRIEILLEEVVKKKASDLHLQVGLPPMLRIDGSLAAVTGADALTDEAVETLIFAILDEDQKQILLKDKEFDFSFAFGDLGRFRVNAFHERGNLAAALRLIPNEIPGIEQLGLPQIVTKFAEYPRGLVLVTGPTGSGKSTTTPTASRLRFVVLFVKIRTLCLSVRCAILRPSPVPSRLPKQDTWCSPRCTPTARPSLLTA